MAGKLGWRRRSGILTLGAVLAVSLAACAGAESPAKTGEVAPAVSVFERGDATGSDFFRIPFLLNTRDGSLIAGTDLNFGSTGDAAENIDAALRRKPQASTHSAADGWQEPVIPSAVHMRDYADESGYKQSSASVIDGAIVQDEVGEGRIIMLIDLFAWNGGVLEQLNIQADGEAKGGRARTVALGDGFATIGGKKYLLLSSENVQGDADGLQGNINNNTDRAKFNFVADVNGTPDANGLYPIFKLEGTPRPYTNSGTPVDDSNLALGAVTNMALDAEFVLHRDGKPLSVTQQSDSGASAGEVPMKVFYRDSELQVYNTSYVLQIVSDDDGVTWKSDKLISHEIKREETNAYILGPGKGIQLREGAHAGRLVVPVYYQTTTEDGSITLKSETIYSDDAGKSWQHGEPMPAVLVSEAALVETPGGGIQAFVRNASASGGSVVTTTSIDGGASWGSVQSAFGGDGRGVNSQVSAVNLAEPITSPTTGTQQPAFVVVTAMDSARVNGVAHVGLFHPDGENEDGTQKYRIEWVNQVPLTTPDQLY